MPTLFPKTEVQVRLGILYNCSCIWMKIMSGGSWIVVLLLPDMVSDLQKLLWPSLQWEEGILCMCWKFGVNKDLCHSHIRASPQNAFLSLYKGSELQLLAGILNMVKSHFLTLNVSAELRKIFLAEIWRDSFQIFLTDKSMCSEEVCFTSLQILLTKYIICYLVSIF